MLRMNQQIGRFLLIMTLFIWSRHSVSAQQKDIYNVAIFLYQNVELLDFAGPTEVFAATPGFKVYTVSVDGKDIISQGLLTVKPEYSIDNAPVPDIIVFPGGNSGPSSSDPKVIKWVQTNSNRGGTLMSVCTGAFILAKAGQLDGLNITTHYGSIESLQQLLPGATVLEHTRFVDNGNIITTAGVSAGIDGSLHMVRRIKGLEVAKSTAHYMEYEKWDPEAGKKVYQNPYLHNPNSIDDDTPIPYEGEIVDHANKLINEGAYPQAATLLESGVKWYPNSGAMYNLLSITYKKMGKAAPISESEFMAMIDAGEIDQAKQVYEKAAKEFPGWKIFTENAMNEKGYGFVGKENYDAAIKLFQLNTIAYPNSGNTWDSLAEAYMISGNKEKAISNYKKSLQVNPGNENAKRMLVKLDEMK